MNVVGISKLDSTCINNNKRMTISEVSLCLLTLLLWIDRILLSYIRAFIMRIPIIGAMADYFIGAAYVILIVLSLPKICKCMRLADLFFGIAVVVICLLNLLLFPENEAVLIEYLPAFLFFTFPLYYIGLSLDFKKVYPWLYRLSLITIVAFTLYKLFISAPMDEVQSLYQGDMWGSYNFLPHVCVVAIAAIRKPNIVNVVLTVIGIIMIATLGSRGPLLCSILAILVYLLFFRKYKHPFIAGIIMIVVGVILILKLESIMLFLYDIAKDAGLSIRVFEKFFNAGLTDSTGRDVLAEKLYQLIEENPIFGYGLFADRVAVGTYAHNIAIELWHSFGIIFGSILLLTIIVVLCRTALKTKKFESYALLFIPLLFSGFIKLFLSGTYLNEIYLFMLLGICINFIRSKQNYF